MTGRLCVPVALLALLAGAGCGEATVRQVSDRRPAGPDVEHAAGQMLMTHISGLSASSRLLGRIRRGEVGSVILYGENISSDRQVQRLTRSLQRAAAAGGNPPLLIGTDQEGGSVKRLSHAPPTMSARQMGSSAHPRTVARAQGLATAAHLRKLGINLDFAPVADIPSSSENFLGDRAFGSASQVLEGATGFAEGLAQGGVAASAKHFPGLGLAGSRDSDFSIVSIGAPAGRLRDGYAPYLSMSAAGPSVSPLVMVSDAAYPALDPSGAPAVLSKRIVQGELATAGMSSRAVITDDLEVPLVRRYPGAAVRAVLAGDDILMYAQRESGSERAYRSILAGIRSGRIGRAAVLGAATKVEALKRTLPGA